MSNYNINKLQGIQYQALKIIYKEKVMCSSNYLHDISGIKTIETRLYDLSAKYIEKAILNNNELIIKLLNDIQFSVNGSTPLEKIGIGKFI